MIEILNTMLVGILVLLGGALGYALITLILITCPWVLFIIVALFLSYGIGTIIRMAINR